jgi:predicted  nucleic acid-binding Zn-ribbon protein
MSKTPKKEAPPSDEGEMIDKMLVELGVDETTKRKLIESGRLSKDIFKIESPEQVRRQIEIEKSAERVQDSLHLIERDMTTIDGVIDRVERDLVPVVLSFLVGLKGNLVSLKDNIVTRSKKGAKTNLQASYIDTEVRQIVNESFGKIESTLTADMASPILEKLRELTEGLKGSVKLSTEELTNLKASMDDFTQRSSTEVEFLAKELTMKPRLEVPKDVAEKTKAMERQIEELQRDLDLSQQKVSNRESEVAALQQELTDTKTRSDDLEDKVVRLRSGPMTDSATMVELRQNIRALEASQEVLEGKLDEANKRNDELEARSKQYASDLARSELNLQDALTKIEELSEEMGSSGKRLAEIDEVESKIRAYESGDKMRELDRVKVELDRTSASLQRLSSDHSETLETLSYVQKRLDGYLGLMQSTEKTRAFLMLEDNGQLAVREIARSLGVSPAIVMQWAEDFQRLGIAKLTDGKTLVLSLKKPVKGEE